MNRTNLISTIISAALLLAPATTFAAPMQPALPPDTVQSLSSELAAVSASVATLASSTVSITIPSGVSDIGLNTSSGNQLKITNVGMYHTVVPSYSNVPSVELSKLIFQYIPCTAATPSVCNVSAMYPAVTSELALSQSTNYLNYSVQLMALSATSTTVQVTDTTEFTNIQNELSSISSRVQALLGK